MYCIYVWRPIMEAISTLENIRPPVVSRWSQKVNNCLRLQCQNILLYIICESSDCSGKHIASRVNQI